MNGRIELDLKGDVDAEGKTLFVGDGGYLDTKIT